MDLTNGTQHVQAKDLNILNKTSGRNEEVENGSPAMGYGSMYVIEAQKMAQNKTGFLGGAFGVRSSRVGDAIDLYCAAANCFKKVQNWSAAGSASEEAAKLDERLGNLLEASQKYVDASISFRKVSPKRAIECLKRSSGIQAKMRFLVAAAKTHLVIAEVYFEEQDTEQAVAHYQKAADFYQGVKYPSHAEKCLLKVAQFAADTGDFSRAIEIYEQAANRNAKDPMLKYGAKDYYFKAALCNLCINPSNAKHAMIQYLNHCPALEDSREFQLLSTILRCVENGEKDGFIKTWESYNRIFPLDVWAASVLRRVEQSTHWVVNLQLGPDSGDPVTWTFFLHRRIKLSKQWTIMMMSLIGTIPGSIFGRIRSALGRS